MSTHSEELELENKSARDLLNKILAATERHERCLQWHRMAVGIYLAEWERTCTLLFIGSFLIRGLYVRDNADFHKPFAILSHVYGTPMVELFGKLETSIFLQIGRRSRPDPVTTRIDFLQYIQKRLA